jgi:hypothetical protein
MTEWLTSRRRSRQPKFADDTEAGEASTEQGERLEVTEGELVVRRHGRWVFRLDRNHRHRTRYEPAAQSNKAAGSLVSCLNILS